MLRTHCKHGHEFTEENIYWYNGSRRCRKCNANKQKEYRNKANKIIEENKTVSMSNSGFIFIAWFKEKE